MFKLFKQKKNVHNNQTKKQLSKIVSQQFETTKNYDMYNFNDCIKCTFEVEACDGNTYYIVAQTTPLLSIFIKMYDSNNIILKEIELTGEIEINNSNIIKFHLGNLNNTNQNYQHLGFGTLMFQSLLETIKYYELLYNCNFTIIHGTLGTEGKSNPKKSVPLYLSFDNYKYSETKKLYLKKETLNLKDCEIYYRIA